jgi:hypothetical protein
MEFEHYYEKKLIDISILPNEDLITLYDKDEYFKVKDQRKNLLIKLLIFRLKENLNSFENCEVSLEEFLDKNNYLLKMMKQKEKGKYK